MRDAAKCRAEGCIDINMLFDQKKIVDLFSQKDYAHGQEYYRQGRVLNLKIIPTADGGQATCTVQGSKPYDVAITISSETAHIYCDCPRFADKRLCKHVAAAMIACANAAKDSSPAESDPRVKSILRAYVDRASQQARQQPENPAKLVPSIHPGYNRNSYPAFSFQVGYDRMYVVRDLKKFVDSVLRRETVSYGKGLTLCHAPEQFDEQSQAILSILLDQFMNGRTMGYTAYSYSYEAALFPSYQKNQITLSGSAFDRLFDLFQNETIAAGNRGVFLLQDRDPSVTLSLERKDKLAELSLRYEDGSLRFFGSAQSLYAVAPGQILRCSPKFRQNVYPLLRGETEKMQMSLSDMPTFCSCVLPEVQDAVSIRDPDQLLQEYLPDECVPIFRFDIEGDTLMLQLDFRYGDVTFHCFEQPKKAVKRDMRTEQPARSIAMQYFPIASPQGSFLLTGLDAIYYFLTEDLEKFHDAGEVFVTDRLREKRVQPASSALGLSVSDGLLTLDFDTGGFPPEELEALYQSLLKRKRYHRLTDGRYLTLDGSAFETMAEMAHMLQLSTKDLAKGQVRLPAFRALYLDDLFSGSEGIQVSRSKSFRELIRNFKSVSEGDYELPAGLDGILRPYQKVGFQWLKTLAAYGFGGILADEMGLGKTLQMIAFLASLDPAERAGPSLVVCPASLILNWADELDKFAPSLTYTLVMGPAGEREKQIASSGGKDVWVTSYELLRQDIERYAPLRFACCILDEAQHIKNQSTLVSKAVKRIDCPQRFILTGTPVENRLSELWNLFDFLMPGYLFSHSAFMQKLEKPAIKSRSEEAMTKLQRMVQPFLLRRMKKEVLKELPPKIEYVRRISLSEDERKVYFAASAAAKNSLTAGDNGKMAVFAALTELRQICCAPGLRFENYTGPSSKLDACIELCVGMAENGHQILLFSQFTSMLDLIRARLDELGITHFTLQGSTPKEKRAQLVKAFNAGEALVFLISLKAGGTGLNLTAADTVILYDPWWNPAAQDQAVDRAHRIGQRSSVQVYKLIAKDTIEEKILKLQSQKAALLDAVTASGESSILDMSKEELLALFE